MEKLKFINEQMAAIRVPYEFGEWTSPVPDFYFVGEITEEPSTTEDGAEESTLILNGFARGKYLSMEKKKDEIKHHFHPIFGLRAKTDSGSIAVFFDGAFYLPTGEANLKRIQINLKIKEWKGDL
jgi:hypothetical protein